jgi:hypothetical protein
MTVQMPGSRPRCHMRVPEHPDVGGIDDQTTRDYAWRERLHQLPVPAHQAKRAGGRGAAAGGRCAGERPDIAGGGGARTADPGFADRLREGHA